MSRAALALALLPALSACGDDGRTDLHVRTTLPAALRAAVEASFESAHPDIDVRFSTEGPEASLARLRSGDGIPFDVWWGAPALVLEAAADGELLLPLGAAAAGDDARGPAGTEPSGDLSAAAAAGPPLWHPVLRTPFVIAFDRTVVSLADAPTDWIDLFHHAWYDDLRLLDPTRSAEGAYFIGAILVEAVRDDDDLDRGFDWLERLDGQVDAYGGTPDELVRALRLGQALVVVLPRAAAESARSDRAPWLHYRLPASGTPVLVLGVGVTATTEVAGAARAFVEHLGTAEAATAAKLHTRWEPALGEVDASRLPPDFELDQAWTAYPPAIDTLAAELDAWLDRWVLDVRR